MQLELIQIRTDGGTQPRATYHFGIAEAYAEDMEAGAVLPPVTVFYDGAEYWLADGFHRVFAAVKIGRATIDADVRQGTQQDAQWYSYSVNQTHGLRRSNEDKQRAVLAALAHLQAAGMSDREIADHVGVHFTTVNDYRNKMKSTVGNLQSPMRTGRDGRTINTANIGKKSIAGPPAQQSEPDEPLTPYEEQIAAAYTNGNGVPAITEPASVGDRRLNQMVDDLIQRLNLDDFRRFIELAAERISVPS
jgi:hypothetical protein